MVAGSTISVVIPAFNAAAYIDECLQSVFRQTRAPFEVLVVDDGSVDETRMIVSQYPVTLLATGQNSGHATARNIGIAAARGDLIAWIDADDVWEPNHLDVVGGLLDRFPEASVAYSSVQRFGNRTGVWHGAANENVIPRNYFWDCLERTCVPAMSAITRSDDIRRVGGFDSAIRIAPDFATWLRMSLEKPFVGTREITARYRRHDQQISNTPWAQRRSVYASRYAIVNEIRRLRPNESRFLATIDLRVQALYRRHLQEAVTNVDKLALRNLLALSELVPNGPRIATQFRLKWLASNGIQRRLVRATKLILGVSG